MAASFSTCFVPSCDSRGHFHVTPDAGWPADLVAPESPELRRQSVHWALDRLPDVFRSKAGGLDPAVLIWILESLLEAQVTALRRLYGIARTQPEVTHVTEIVDIMDLLAQTGAALVRAQREVAMVKSALALSGGHNGDSLLD